MINKIDSIQIIGTQRSGSNLLRVMLNQYDEISAPHPPHVLKTFVPLLPHYGNLKDEGVFYQLAHDIAAFVNANPVPWLLDHLTAEDLIERSRKNSLLSLYEAVYSLKMEQDKAQAWCCKSMFNEYYSENIEREGIVPFYIYLYRDGRDVAASFKKAIVGPKHIYFLARKWVEDQKKALEISKRVEPSRFYSVSYEELVTEPQKVLQKLSSALGLNYSDKLLDYYTSDESKRTASSGEMWKNVAQPIMRTNVGKFHAELSAEEIHIFEQIAGDTLVQLGYSPMSGKKSNKEIQFSESQIEAFSLENKRLQSEVRKRAAKHDLDVRSKQEIILKEIQLRLTAPDLR